jgi:hypothetical protein
VAAYGDFLMAAVTEERDRATVVAFGCIHLKIDSLHL